MKALEKERPVMKKAGMINAKSAIIPGPIRTQREGISLRMEVSELRSLGGRQE
jgi:hypothetical protein